MSDTQVFKTNSMKEAAFTTNALWPWCTSKTDRRKLLNRLQGIPVSVQEICSSEGKHMYVNKTLQPNRVYLTVIHPQVLVLSGMFLRSEQVMLFFTINASFESSCTAKLELRIPLCEQSVFQRAVCVNKTTVHQSPNVCF